MTAAVSFSLVRVWLMAVTVAVGLSLQAATLPDLLAQFHRHAAAGELAEAEAVARQAVARHPGSRDARLALANALLWQEKYREAEKQYRVLLAEHPSDVEARLGLANALYWSGDFAAAEREYARIADHPQAARAIGEIRAASAPGFELRAFRRSDDQPFRVWFAEAGGYVFSNAATKWHAAVGTYTFDGERGDGSAPFARAGVEASLPRMRSTARLELETLRFPDDHTALLGSASFDRRLRRSTITASAARRELFGSAASVNTHPWVDALELRWHRPNAAFRAEVLRYFDGNEGLAADGWILVPVTSSLAVGASAAFRDTSESRFTPDGIYDPYWTPIDLREGRAIAVASGRLGRVTARLHLDGGIAREELNGSFNPWRAALAFSVPVHRLTVTVEAERLSTVFYTANEIRTSVAGRF